MESKTVNLNKAVLSWKRLSKELEGMFAVADALEEIKNLENYKAEAEREAKRAKSYLKEANKSLEVGLLALKDLKNETEAERGQGKAIVNEARDKAKKVKTEAENKAAAIVADARAWVDNTTNKASNAVRLMEHKLEELQIEKSDVSNKVDKLKEELAKLKRRFG